MPFPARLALLSAAFALACLNSPTLAQEKKDASAQKAAAVASLKKADLGKAGVVETPSFLIATTLPEAKAKALGAVLEKVVPVARKAAHFEDKEEAWKGKLTLFVLPESRDFKGFIRNVVGEAPGGVHYSLRGDEPFVVDPVDVPAKATEADHYANTAAIVATAFLRAKGGAAEMPEWLREGFGRVTAMRAEGVNSRRYTTYKTGAKTAVLVGKGGTPPPPLADLWGEGKPANAELVTNSFVEYLAYGPGAKEFRRVIYGFSPAEGGGIPTVPQALEAAGWKDIAVLEAAWRKWVQTGK